MAAYQHMQSLTSLTLLLREGRREGGNEADREACKEGRREQITIRNLNDDPKIMFMRSRRSFGHSSGLSINIVYFLCRTSWK